MWVIVFVVVVEVSVVVVEKGGTVKQSLLAGFSRPHYKSRWFTSI